MAYINFEKESMLFRWLFGWLCPAPAMCAPVRPLFFLPVFFSDIIKHIVDEWTSLSWTIEN